MANTVDESDNKTSIRVDPNSKLVDIHIDANLHETPLMTLKNYTHEDTSKRHKIGSQVDRGPCLNTFETGFFADVIRRTNRDNEGYSKKKAIDEVQEIKPDLFRKAEAKAFTRHVLDNHANVLEKIPVKVQATTTKQSATTVK